MSTPFKRAAFHTLGCKLNITETSAIAREFDQAGYMRVEFNDLADVYVINTCTVTDNADKKCRKLIRQVHRRAPNAYIAVTGCYAEINPEELAEIPGVNLVTGNEEKFNLARHIEEHERNGNAHILPDLGNGLQLFKPSHTVKDHTRTFVKIQDGCDYSCSYCTIPKARGMSRNQSISDTVERISEIAGTSVQEVILSGINLGDFGKSTDEDFLSLIKALDEIEGISRFRISSIEPNLITDEMIEFIAGSKRFLPHFHIPLQSGSDEILKQMQRRYKRDLYLDRILKIKEVLPHACIAADVIVGFPGETDTHFRESYNFIKKLDISYLHVFPYSERADTAAAEMAGSVPISEWQVRSRILQNYSKTKRNDFNLKFINSIRTVLIEQVQGGLAIGHTDNYIKVGIPAEAVKVNEIYHAKLTRCDGDIILGEKI